jgi:hypothetical protein
MTSGRMVFTYWFGFGHAIVLFISVPVIDTNFPDALLITGQIIAVFWALLILSLHDRVTI